MTWQHLLAFNLALLVAIASPGPALLVAIRTTVSSGRVAGMQVGAGLGLIAAGWTLAALLGFEAIFRWFPGAYLLISVAGACYLMYIAFSLWRGAKHPVRADTGIERRAFVQGIMINALNPKSVMFAAAVLIVVFPPDLRPVDKAIVVANHLLVELGFYAVLASAMSSPVVRDRYLRAKAAIDRTAALVLGLLALRLLFDH